MLYHLFVKLKRASCTGLHDINEILKVLQEK